MVLKRWVVWLVGLVVIAGLVGCAATGSGGPAAKRGSGGLLPLGAHYYGYGVSQDTAYFADHVQQAQQYYGLFPGRYWSRLSGGRPYVRIGMLIELYRLHVRWELKDGRQFIAENIDVESIMGNYFRTHWLEVQHVREARPRERGDFAPELMVEVREDKVRLKWRLTTNHVPIEERGRRGLDLSHEEFLVAEVPGQPTSGLDFARQREEP